MIKKTVSQAGRSLIEMLATITIITMITMGAIQGSSLLMRTFYPITLKTDLEQASMDIKDMYMWRKGYMKLDMAFLCQNKVFKCTDGNKAPNPWGGTITISSKTFDSFEITLSDVPKRACTSLLGMEWVSIFPKDTSCSAKQAMVFTSVGPKDEACSGDSCGPAPDYCAGVSCNGNGSCNPTTGRCVCSGGWTGYSCNTPPNLCAGWTSSICQPLCDKVTGNKTNASNGTACTMKDYSTGYCDGKGACVASKCADWISTTCQPTCDKLTGNKTNAANGTTCTVSTSGDGVCNGNGVCEKNMCAGWTATTCQTGCDKLTGNKTNASNGTTCTVITSGDGMCDGNGTCIKNQCDENTLAPCQKCNSKGVIVNRADKSACTLVGSLNSGTCTAGECIEKCIGTPNSGTPLVNFYGGCYSCYSSSWENIGHSDNSKALCEDKCAGGKYERISVGPYCSPDRKCSGTSSSGTPLADYAGNCYACNYNGGLLFDADTQTGCIDKCAGGLYPRKIENTRYCVPVTSSCTGNALSGAPITDWYGKCHSCDTTERIYMDGLQNRSGEYIRLCEGQRYGYSPYPEKCAAGTYNSSFATGAGSCVTCPANKSTLTLGGACKACGGTWSSGGCS